MTVARFGEFEVIEQMSKRGTVSTLKCRDQAGDTLILKVFEAPNVKDHARVESRGAALARLDHPGLARARGIARADGDIGLIYDWVPGETIAALIERGVRFTDAELYDCMTQVLEALRHAHQMDPPVIHRDLKPQNIVWTGKRYVVIDFDAAREVFADSGTASVVGTTGYAGPEQFVGGAEPRSDQYGLAATILHMATHRHPTDFPLAGLRIDLSKTTLSLPMRRLLDRMLAPEVEGRFADVEDACEAVDTEQGLEPWQVAYEPLREIQSSLTITAEGDALEIEIASRTSSVRWVMFAIATLSMFPVYILGSVLPTALNDPVIGFLMLPLQIICFIVAIYCGSRARQEYRARRPAKLRIERDAWSLLGGPKDITMNGTIPIRALAHNAAASTGGVTPISIRQALAVSFGGTDIRFGDGLLPLESRVLVEVVQAFQQPSSPELDLPPSSLAAEILSTEEPEEAANQNRETFIHS